jgi:hypothetical protein
MNEVCNGRCYEYMTGNPLYYTRTQNLEQLGSENGI